MTDLKTHWENVYDKKQFNEMSWFESFPTTSLSLIKQLNLSSNASIIDIGGGESNLTNNLLIERFQNLSVLDISSNAIARSKKSCQFPNQVEWIESNILNFQPNQEYDLWHDRAVFHFLTNQEEITKYIQLVSKSIKQKGFLLLATFSKNGPNRCSNLNISQYDVQNLEHLFRDYFNLIKGFSKEHLTPSGKIQDFTYVIMQRL